MTTKNYTLDGIDKTILKYLMDDARIPILKIAREIGISGAAIHQRLRKIESAGYILGSKYIIDPKNFGYNTMAFIGIYLDSGNHHASVLKSLDKIQEVLESHYTTGNYSIFIKVMCRDNEHLLELLTNEIQKIKGVARTETILSLDQQINRQIDI
ncbi:Lrp/AsnC ligand binding domain-containing protein [Aureivirga sp. CE67]|uniref:Lrp/AsnC ligand binding domain-containing protein n=1 Tax=Aureivirga sp. CE67 TaxID=1788983 RepID=UPI0018CBA7DD|nr:Lrp/AsnC ligand binding domain-containing protein [Aureivirga sp. CE67]